MDKNVNENNPSYRFSVISACGVVLNIYFCRVSEEQRETFTQLTEILGTALHFQSQTEQFTTRLTYVLYPV